MALRDTENLEVTAPLTSPSPLTSLFPACFSWLRPDYVDTENRTTQWNPPSWRVRSSSSRIQSVDTPLRRVHRGSGTGMPQPASPPAIIPPTTTAATGGVVNEPLPPNWENRTTPNGKTCEKPSCSTCRFFVSLYRTCGLSVRPAWRNC